MKKIKLIYFALNFLMACGKIETLQAQTSTVWGNVADKLSYTDIKPDGGAKIQLFDLSKKYLGGDSITTTIADVNGNYIFRDIAAGNYILYITSKSALVEPMFLLIDLSGSKLSEQLLNISGFKFSGHQPALQSEINSLFNQSVELSKNNRGTKYNKVESAMEADIKKYFDTLPEKIKSFFGFGDERKYGREFKEIRVMTGKDENYTTVFDIYLEK